MMHFKDSYKKLVHYLQGDKDSSIRRDITSWYDEHSSSIDLDESAQVKIKERAKERIFSSIKTSQPRAIKRSIIAWSAAAAAILAIGYFGYEQIQQNTYQVATSTELARVQPAQEKALIILENGEEIDLDQIGLNQSIQVGEIVIKKDGKGKVSYHNAHTGAVAVQMNTLQIPKAAVYELTLTDGTKVKLNSDSKLIYPSSFGASDRIVKLEGEAYFEVSKTSNKSRFIVESKSQSIEVLGTKFNIKAYPEDPNSLTTLAEGAVEVHKKSSSEIALLKPSQQAMVNTSSPIQTKNINLDDALSWLNNQFYFNGANTEEVLQEISRWYDVDIQFDRKKTNTQYSGRIPRNLSLEKLVELLNYAEMQVKPVIGGNKRIKLIIT